MEPQQGAILTTAEPRPAAAPLAKPGPSSEATASPQTLSAEPSSESSNEEFSGDDGDEEEEEEEDEGGMFLKDGRCQRCLVRRGLARNRRQDHRKTHYLQGTLGVAVPEANKCARCVRKGTKCLVAREPDRKELNTLQCEGCLGSSRCCSFKKTYKHLRIRNLRSHPARWPKF